MKLKLGRSVNDGDLRRFSAVVRIGAASAGVPREIVLVGVDPGNKQLREAHG